MATFALHQTLEDSTRRDRAFLRLSLSRDTTEAEIDDAVAAMAAAVAELQ